VQRHFTATAFIVDPHGRTLLLWHKRLERWMPPGGHVDPHETPEETARRECKEETGLDVEIVGEEQDDVFARCPEEGRTLKKPFAFLLEEIPPSSERNEPAHQHMDFVYLARIIDKNQTPKLNETEGSAIRWFTREEIAALDPESEIYGNVQRYILRVLDEIGQVQKVK
jgi:8-oxo-dGTP pyrophosphatase MutT (NUDIX family)